MFKFLEAECLNHRLLPAGRLERTEENLWPPPPANTWWLTTTAFRRRGVQEGFKSRHNVSYDR